MYYEWNAYMSASMCMSAFVKTHLWFTNDDKSRVTPGQRHWQAPKPAHGKIASCFRLTAFNNIGSTLFKQCL